MKITTRKSIIKVTLTWDDWWPMWFSEDDYFSVGFGPLFIQVSTKDRAE